MPLTDNSLRSWHPAAVVAGGVLLLLGVAMLLTPYELPIEDGRLIAPVVMILIGATILLGNRTCVDKPAADEATRRRRRAARRNRSTSALWMIGIGCWLLVSQTHLFGLGFGTSWPLLLIVMGLLLMIRGWR